MADEPTPKEKREGRKRAIKAARIGVTISARSAAQKASKKFLPEQASSRVDAHVRIKNAQDVLEQLGNMRGVMMKLAQMAGYLDTRVPQPVREALSQLQSQAPPMTWELAKGVIEEELGLPCSELFSEIEPQPFAAASIGQVHRAKTLDGAVVAVKVQYPQASSAIRADLSNTTWLSSVLHRLFPSWDTEEVVEELKERLSEELDYALEAEHQMRFFSYYQDHPFIVIPKVIGELSSKMVLTSELVEGASFSEVMSWSQNEKDMIGETIFRFVFRSLYRLKSFNGDPHPGNYVFLGGGKVGFLDFGFVKSFDLEEMATFEAMIKSMVLYPDPEEFSRVVIKAGLLRPAHGAILAQDVTEYFRIYYDLVLRDEYFAVTERYPSALLSHSFSVSHPIAPYLNVPRSFVVVQRINLGLYAVLAQLGASANWRKIAEDIWPFVNSGPTTELGRLEEAWYATHAGGQADGIQDLT